MDNPGIVHHATLANIDYTICSTRQCAAIGNRGIAHQMSTKKRPADQPSIRNASPAPPAYTPEYPPSRAPDAIGQRTA